MFSSENDLTVQGLFIESRRQEDTNIFKKKLDIEKAIIHIDEMYNDNMIDNNAFEFCIRCGVRLNIFNTYKNNQICLECNAILDEELGHVE